MIKLILLAKVSAMKFLCGLLLLSLISGVVVTAQEETSESDITARDATLNVRVLYESAFVRALPSPDAEAVASVFENDVLEAIGRNADGTWIEVRRPYREVSLGWILGELVIHGFSVSSLPITDLTTGITGAEPVYDTGLSLYILIEATLRAEPFINASQIDIVPIMRTLPVLERNADARWLKVNYLGTVGWVNSFNINSVQDLTQAPISMEHVADSIVVEIIPPEIQLAQAYRLRDYVQPIHRVATDVANFWSALSDGETLPCQPPSEQFAQFVITQRDLYELPELRRASRRLPRAIDDINSAISDMQRCGVYTPQEIRNAYARAINARIILSTILTQMDAVESLLIPQISANN